MNFALTAEQQMVRESIREFAQREIAPLVDEAEKGNFPVQIFPRIGELGYLGFRIPEQYGGSDQGKMEEVLLFEEMGYVCAGLCTAMHPQLLTSRAIYEFGTEDLKQRYLVPALKGQTIFALGITEPDAGSDVAATRTMARKVDGGYVLNGAKAFITNATIADTILIVASTDRSKRAEGLAVFLVDKDTPGFQATRMHMSTLRSSDTAEISLVDCFVPEKNVLGGETGGFNKAMGTLYSARITHSGRSVGLARAAYDAAYEYALQRNVFGKTIAKFQAIKFKLARMAMEIEAARLLSYQAAWLLDHGQPFIKEGSMAKLFNSEMAFHVANEAVQILGGFGFDDDSRVARYFRDARVFQVADGTSEIQQTIIAKQLGL